MIYVLNDEITRLGYNLRQSLLFVNFTKSFQYIYLLSGHPPMNVKWYVVNMFDILIKPFQEFILHPSFTN